ncbi:MAG: hypothetical protein D6805_05255 [Planctomycetota bacterium]|nr:MAG: hypothetical protein D6805_05255 [Planctomycetota bacterium]
MPIFDQEYKKFEGKRRGSLYRIATIAWQGIRLQWKQKNIRRLVSLLNLPLLYFGFIFFLIGYAFSSPTWREFLQGVLPNLVGRDFTRAFFDEPEKFRPVLWSFLFFVYFYYVQIFASFLLVAFVGPRLVSDDLKTGAMEIYSAKISSNWEYILGKFLVVAFYLASVSFFPSLLLYVFSLILSPSFSVVHQTISVVGKIFFSCFWMILFCSSAMLFFSSLTKNARYLSVGWIALWGISKFIYTFLREGAKVKWAPLISLEHNISTVAYHIYGISHQIRARFIPKTFQDLVEKHIGSHQAEFSTSFLLLFISSLVCFIGLKIRLDKKI